MTTPITMLWAAKGGSGTTTIAATLALTSPHHTLLVDLDGELPDVLGLPEPAGPGIAEWLRSDTPAEALSDVAINIDTTTRLVPRGTGPIESGTTRWTEFACWAATHAPVIIDAGSGHPPPKLDAETTCNWLVTRACYLSLRRTLAAGTQPDAVILITEPGRALQADDVTYAVGAPVIAVVAHDPAVARCIDAGLLAVRIPRGLRHHLANALPQLLSPPNHRTERPATRTDSHPERRYARPAATPTTAPPSRGIT